MSALGAMRVTPPTLQACDTCGEKKVILILFVQPLTEC